MNFSVFLGNLTRDVELKTVGGNGTQLAKFGVAINRKYKKDGEWVNEPCFLDCEAWGKTAEQIADNFAKGDPIILQAEVRMDSWEDKETGKKRTKHKWVVNRWEFVPGNRKDRGEDGGREPATAGSTSGGFAGEGGDGDIPF